MAEFVWERTVSKAGRIDLGGFRYGVGTRFSGKRITIRFEAATREFGLYDGDRLIRTHPARGLSVEDLTGLEMRSSSLGPQQLPLPLPEFLSLKG